MNRQGVSEGGLPQVGQGQGSDPLAVHTRQIVADHVGVFGVVHVAVEVQIAVNDGTEVFTVRIEYLFLQTSSCSKAL